MIRKCPKCEKPIRPTTYMDRQHKRHYFECECGWSNKPQELKEKENAKYE